MTAAAALEVSRFIAVVNGEDVHTQLACLAVSCGWGSVDCTTLEVSRADLLDDDAAAAARRFGGTIKPVLWATCEGDRIEAFAGPALVPIGNTFAAVANELDGVEFAGRYRSRVVPAPIPRCAAPRDVVAPHTDWLVRARFPGLVPRVEAAAALFAPFDLHTISSVNDPQALWLRLAAAPRARVDRAITELNVRHRVAITAIRAL